MAEQSQRRLSLPVDPTMWRTAWKDAGLGAAPDLTLGTDETASLTLTENVAGLRTLCQMLLKRIGESATLPPACEGTWPWTVRLTASSRDDEIEAILELPVLLQRAPERNASPVIDGIEIDGLLLRAGDPELEALPLERKSKTELRVSIDADQAEMYTPALAVGEASSAVAPRRESLLFTWFVAGGETARMRTTFREGAESLRSASQNEWPTAGAGGAADWFVVVRDSRGGVDFIRGRALFED